MRKPTVQQLRDYADTIDFPTFDPQAFIDHYDSNGWKVGRSKMVQWQATVRTWKRNEAKWGEERQSHKPKATMPIGLRNKVINRLNERKTRILRTFPEGNYARWASDELAKIQQQLARL